AHKCRIAGHRIGSVHFFKVEIGETRHQTRNAPASGLHFDRHRDRVLVILHHKHKWQLQIGSCVHGLPELAFAGRAIPKRNVGDFVAVELDVFELSIVALDFFGGVRMSSEITPPKKSKATIDNSKTSSSTATKSPT